ncbi:MAG: hypothetical protein HOC71_03370 [Candidatus Latescibacteria bacterium]|nr:hypothetical protein [Candidatus Latescibacterota bacterium]
MGTQTLVAEQYNHNFFTIDNEYIGENYELELFFPPVFETFHPEKFNRQRSFMPYSKIQDNKIIVLQDVDVDVGIFSIMSGFGNSVSHHHGIIRNKRTRACVDIKGDTRLAGFHFWTDIITFCPEFFIGISVKPGETQNWKRIYTFYEE